MDVMLFSDAEIVVGVGNCFHCEQSAFVGPLPWEDSDFFYCARCMREAAIQLIESAEMLTEYGLDDLGSHDFPYPLWLIR